MAGATMRCQIRGGGAQHPGLDRRRRPRSRADYGFPGRRGDIGQCWRRDPRPWPRSTPATLISEERSVTNSDALGANARQVLIDIFRKKDVTAVDRNFSKSLIHHDPNLADGIDGMTSFAADVASSPAADITIYRTLADGTPYCSIPGTRGSKTHPARCSQWTCSVSKMTRSSSTGAASNRSRQIATFPAIRR